MTTINSQPPHLQSSGGAPGGPFATGNKNNVVGPESREIGGHLPMLASSSGGTDFADYKDFYRY